MTEDLEHPVGEKLPDSEARVVWDRFVARFKRPGQPQCRPTHCEIETGSSFWGYLFDSDWIKDDEVVFVIQERGLMQRFPQDVWRMKMSDFRFYLQRRAPWAQVDTYILCEDMRFCAVITHDDVFLIADPPRRKSAD